MTWAPWISMVTKKMNMIKVRIKLKKQSRMRRTEKTILIKYMIKKNQIILKLKKKKNQILLILIIVNRQQQSSRHNNSSFPS